MAAVAPPSPADLSSSQLVAALGVSLPVLKNWDRHRVIPSVCVGRARRYDLEQVMEALRAHGQPDPAASSAASSTTPGMGSPAVDDC